MGGTTKIPRAKYKVGEKAQFKKTGHTGVVIEVHLPSRYSKEEWILVDMGDKPNRFAPVDDFRKKSWKRKKKRKKKND